MYCVGDITSSPFCFRSMMGSMIGGSSRISIDSITDEITEPSHTQDFSTGLTGIELYFAKFSSYDKVLPVHF